MKKTIPLILVLALCLSLCACSMPTLSLKPSIESRGYDSPEEAFLAYAEALKTGDVSKMLSTFAIETYVKNYDLEAYLDYTRAFSPNQGTLEAHTPYTQEINFIARQYQITQQLKNMYTLIALGEDAFTSIITFNGAPYDDPDDFLDDYVMDDWMETLAKMRVDDDFQYLDDFFDTDTVDSMEEHLDDQCDFYGCKEIVPLALEIKLDGEEYLMTINVARYGDKWYNLTLNSSIALLLGAPTYSAGLCCVE